MTICPCCGNLLHERLNDGVGSCSKCHQVFTTSLQNRLLSTGWYMRKFHGYDRTQLGEETGLTQAEIAFVYDHVVENGLSNEEFVQVVKKYA